MAILQLCDCEWPGQMGQFKYPALSIAHPRIHYEVHRVTINDAQLVSQCRAWCTCVCTGGPPFSLCKYSSTHARILVLIKYHLKEAKNVSLLAYFLSTDNKGPT